MNGQTDGQEDRHIDASHARAYAGTQAHRHTGTQAQAHRTAMAGLCKRPCDSLAKCTRANPMPTHVRYTCQIHMSDTDVRYTCQIQMSEALVHEHVYTHVYTHV